MATVLALDVGSSSVRAQRFDEHGDPVDERRQERYDGTDPDEIVRLVHEVIGGRDEGVDAVGTSCFGHSLIALDDAGRPLTPVLGWRDLRSAEAAAALVGIPAVVALLPPLVDRLRSLVEALRAHGGGSDVEREHGRHAANLPW